MDTNKLCEFCGANPAKLQETQMDLKEQLAAAQELASRYEKELSGERFYRKDLESKLTALSLEAENKIGKCFETNNIFEERLEILARKQESDLRIMQAELNTARSKCKSFADDIIQLDKRYQKLLGTNREKASEMREKSIELPQTVDQLQFFALQLREELIETRASYEHTVNELRNELLVAQEQLREAQNFFNDSDIRTNDLLPIELCESSRSSNSMNISENDVRYQAIIAELEHQISVIQKERNRSEAALSESRRKCTTLQTELDTCEMVQKDFVTLSQQLQIQLEKLRQAEKEVRWQFEEDVFVCNKCETDFHSKNLEKDHCKHCGKVFCQSCLSNKVSSGPNHREAKVCDVCYTLLNRDSVPFFSNMSLTKSKG